MAHWTGGGTSPSVGAQTQAQAGSGKSVFIRLTFMMLLEFLVFGSWYATLGLVLATSKLASIIGYAYSLGALAAIVSPVLLGALGDRVFASQKVLGTAHFLGGCLMFTLPAIVRSGNGHLALAVIFLYMCFFQPTLGLANAIAFRHLGHHPKAFPYARVFGTVGWVVAGLAVGAMGLSGSTGVFNVTGGLSIFFAIYSFTLPSTPPPAKGKRTSFGDVLGVKSLVLFKNRNFLVLIICAFLTSISLGVYNAYASLYLSVLGIRNVAGVLAIGQASEVVFIVSIPFVLARFGMKWSLLMGMVMWGVRFSLFAAAASGADWLAVVGVAVQGICNDFFLILSAMYIDRVAPVDLKAQAQSWLIMAISGFGAAAGALISGAIYGANIANHPEAGASAWSVMWLVPIGSAAITAVLWISLFKYSRSEHGHFRSRST
ncbi:MFS transporter [Burkholderia multivorans]|uniref:MFS transporter n=1 Tax=Burkholderia multivorans TaxID=87883 RepID=UPI001C24B13D|nr:MFS transporter [Burkholderia multivorans]MBU9205426.1 MFS transporter [Burkholderia multivorans]MCO8353435.1 MFS transporter [Burkholderia multivorans]MCO8385694.1 MFS transporter [Burkholderia multivorans]MCO8406625.1 MFS transporter [Burkholderia multivorans]MCO8434790.1 MFS transporter [Burkholderia multivorans]